MLISTTVAESIGPEHKAPVLLPAHEASYEVLRRGRKIGEVHVRLAPGEDGVWLFETETEATAAVARMLGVSATESAHFMWHDGHILALTYHQVARAPTRTRWWQHQFDWDQGISNTRTYDGDHQISLEPGVIDPLTLRLAVAAKLHQPEARDTDHQFRVLERDEIEDQQFLFEGRETLSLDIGCFDAVRMRRFRRESSSRNYHSWHAETFAWMPMRILQLRDGREELDIRLISTSLQLAPETCE